MINVFDYTRRAGELMNVLPMNLALQSESEKPIPNGKMARKWYVKSEISWMFQNYGAVKYISKSTARVGTQSEDLLLFIPKTIAKRNSFLTK